MLIHDYLLQKGGGELPLTHFSKGKMLFRDNENFSGVYIMHKGAVKTYRMTSDDKDIVTGFYLPGDFVGIDDVFCKCFSSYARALTDCSVTKISLLYLNELIAHPKERREILWLLGNILRQNKERFYLVSRMSADERVASFIRDLFVRVCLPGYRTKELRMPMTRADVANYIGLTPETVSRVLVRMAGLGIISLNNRYIALLRPDLLKTYPR